MDELFPFVVGFLIELFVTYAAYLCAKRKNRSGGWAVATFLFSPTLLLLLLLPSKEAGLTAQLLTCEACQNTLSSLAEKCPHCGHPNRFSPGKAAAWKRLIELSGGLFVLASCGYLVWIVTQFEATAGLPSCDSSYGQSTVIRALKNAPVGRVQGLEIIKFRESSTIDITQEEVNCRATVDMNNGQTREVTYHFYREGDQIMVKAQLEGLNTY